MDNCIFCKIISGIIPSEKLYEDDKMILIKDLDPKAPTHLLAIPKKHIANLFDLEEIDSALIGHINLKSAEVMKKLGHTDGFRVVQNNGASAGQTVFHLHFHILAGREFNWPPG